VGNLESFSAQITRFSKVHRRAVLLDNLARPRATVKGKSYERVGAFVVTIVVESQRRLCKLQRVTVKLHPRL